MVTPKGLSMPKTNEEYWGNKIKRNKSRDKTVNKELKALGWKVIRIWEYDIKMNLNKCLFRIFTTLKTSNK